MEFSRQEYWSGLTFPTPGVLSNPEIESMSPESPASAGGFLTAEPPGKPFKSLVFHSFIHTLVTYLSGVFYVPDLVLDAWVVTVN